MHVRISPETMKRLGITEEGLRKADAAMELRRLWQEAGRPQDLTEFCKNPEVRRLAEINMTDEEKKECDGW